MTLASLDLHALRRWIVAARTDLAVFEDALNRLNVFPVPDGDTGTNFLLTLDGALGSLSFTNPTDLGAAADALAQATLMAARGNSGVILSQLARGFAEVLVESTDASLGPLEVAAALRRASDYGWQSVSKPMEGTILSVASAAADGADQAANGADLYGVVSAAVDSAREALRHTTQQLESLRSADVVDAGGAGYLIVIEALARVVEHDGVVRARSSEAPDWLPATMPAGLTHAGECGDGTLEGPAYEVMYLLSDTDPARVDVLRERLGALGDSLVVAGGTPVWSVHVHVDDVGAALNAGVEAGRPHRFRITRFADEIAERTAQVVAPDTRTLVVAITEAPGLRQVAKDADYVSLAGDAGMIARASAARSIREAEVDAVLLLTDSERSVRTAQSLRKSLSDRGITVLLPETTSRVQFVCALAVARPPDDSETVQAEVNDALDGLRMATVTIADKPIQSRDGECAKGDVVALVDGIARRHGAEALTVAAAIIDDLLRDGGELVTLVTCDKTPSALADTLSASLRAPGRGLEVSVVEGGGSGPLLAIGVE